MTNDRNGALAAKMLRGEQDIAVNEEISARVGMMLIIMKNLNRGGDELNSLAVTAPTHPPPTPRSFSISFTFID